jgi:monolysocardiolipin acyltransferase
VAHPLPLKHTPMATFLPAVPNDDLLLPNDHKPATSPPVIPDMVSEVGDVTMTKVKLRELSFEALAARPFKLPNELFDLKHHRVLDDCLRALSFGTFAYASRIYMQLFNEVTVKRKEVLDEAVLKRPYGQPLVTITNHNSCIDDPTIFAMVAPVDVWRDSRSVRWALCAHEVCFKNSMLQKFFTACKTSPMYRGAGLEQAPIQFAIDRLRVGDWYHLFPEGFVIQQNNYQMARFRWGVGKILTGVRDLNPILIPFVHKGMETINPLPGVTFKTGKKISAIVGDPIPLQDLFDNFEKLQKRK